MPYGEFDAERREYVITRPDTPQPWSTYLGDLNFGAIVTQHGTGYAFERSAAKGRLLRGRFNALPATQPGRFVYLRDRASGEYWSATWQPVAKPLGEFQTRTRLGTGYAIVESRYREIASELGFHVPLGARHEVWALRVTNEGAAPRHLQVFSFCEFTNDSNQSQDLVNLQYTLFIARSYYRDGLLLQSINEAMSEVGAVDAHDGADQGGPGIWRFFTQAGADPAAYDSDRDAFIGPYRTYANPAAVERGQCGNSTIYGGNFCGSLQTDLALAPGESRTLLFLLGAGDETVARSVREGYLTGGWERSCAEIEALRRHWHGKLERLQVRTPEPAFDVMANTWNAYQAFINFFWSRAASMVYVGLRDGLGYRDTVNDIMGIMHLDPVLAGERLRFMLSGQVHHGGALPIVQFNHRAGSEITPEDPGYLQKTGYSKYRCDDHLWLFPAVRQYLCETGEMAFLEEVIPYADTGQATVYEHLRAALQFSLNHLGQHGLVLGLHADWNDCLRLGETGESLFASAQLYLAFTLFAEFAALGERPADRQWALQQASDLRRRLLAHAWQGDQFVRGFTEAGYTVGHRANREASLWMNSQAYPVIAGLISGEDADRALAKVEERLATDFGVMLCHPAFREYGLPVARMILYPAGMKENAGIFSQAQGWMIQAEALAGHGARALRYYRSINPAARNDDVDRRLVEPYVHSQFTEGRDSPNHGRAHNPWLTGTAATVMVATVEGILGIRPDYHGLRLEPALDPTWKAIEIRRVFRGKTFHIRVENPAGVESGVAELHLNGQRLPERFIPLAACRDHNEVRVVLG